MTEEIKNKIDQFQVDKKILYFFIENYKNDLLKKRKEEQKIYAEICNCEQPDEFFTNDIMLNFINTSNYEEEPKEIMFRILGCSLEAKIKVDLLMDIEGVTKVIINSNRKNCSLEIKIKGGSDEEIAKSIYKNVTPGIELIGDKSIEIKDNENNIHNIRFNRI